VIKYREIIHEVSGFRCRKQKKKEKLWEGLAFQRRTHVLRNELL